MPLSALGVDFSVNILAAVSAGGSQLPVPLVHAAIRRPLGARPDQCLQGRARTAPGRGPRRRGADPGRSHRRDADRRRKLLRHRPRAWPGAEQRVPAVHARAGCAATIRGAHLLRDRGGLPQARPAPVVADRDVPPLECPVLRHRRDRRRCSFEGGSPQKRRASGANGAPISGWLSPPG